MWISENWTDYELIDCSNGQKLERWGNQILVRPDPQAIWNTERTNPAWNKPSAKYSRSSDGGGHWEKSNVPESWQETPEGLTPIVANDPSGKTSRELVYKELLPPAPADEEEPKQAPAPVQDAKPKAVEKPAAEKTLSPKSTGEKKN